MPVPFHPISRLVFPPPNRPFPPSSFSPSIHLRQVLRRKPQLRASTRITEDNKLALQEDIPENAESNPIITLNPSEARATAITDGGIVHIIAWHDGAISFDCKSDGG